MKKVVIVGAGPAGLTAAYELLKQSNKYEVIVLEKSDRLGGISSSVSFGGNVIDTGIHRFFSKSSKVNEIWEELLPIQGKLAYDDIVLKRNKHLDVCGPNPEKEDNVMLVKDRVTRIYYGKKFYDYPVSLNFETLKNLGFINIIIAGFSYLKALIFKKKEDSLENLYINKFGKKLYKMFFESYTEKVWGRHPREISADWGNQRVKGISIMEVLKDVFRKIFKIKNKNNTETSLIETFTYPKLGTIQMWNEMAKKIEDMGGKVLLNCDVKKIKVIKDKIREVEYECSGEVRKEKVDIFLSSMPISELLKSMDGVKIPKKIYDAGTKLPYREFMSVGLLVKKLNLVNNTKIKTINNIIPDSWIYVQEPYVKMGRIQIFNNWSPYLFKDKKDINNKVLISLEYFASKGDKYWEMSDEEFINFAVDEAISMNLFSKDDVIESTRIKVNKAYPAYFDSYKDMDKIVKYLDRFLNLYCIGRNGQHRYNNMDHSMMTGVEAASCILNNRKSKADIWNVNTEQEYHEIKNTDNK